MKTYNVTVKRDGHTTSRVIDTFDNIEDAREELVRQMSYLDKGSDTTFIPSEEARQEEIRFLNEIAKEEGIDTSDSIEEVKSWTVPCLIDQPTHGEICNADQDSFYYDCELYAIECEETCEPFEAGTLYPALVRDEQGNNKWADYVDGEKLVGLAYECEFADLDEDIKEQILDNIMAEDIEAVEDGQVWVNDDRTIFAVLY